MEWMSLCEQEPTSLEEVQKQFDWWRANRQKRGAVPESLWEAALSLYPTYPLSRISTALGLDYGRLKRRVDEQRRDPAEPMPMFVDLGFSGNLPGSGRTVEFRHRDRAMLMRGVDGAELMKLARLFWRHS
jgi:hypothetical protein